MRKLVAFTALLGACAHQPSNKPTPAPVAQAQPAPPEDPNLWLEDVTGDKALAWVRAQNGKATGELTTKPAFTALRDRLRTILDSDAKIPYASRQGAYLYNFWKDGTHPRGLWRRTSLAEYKKPQPKWETVIDVDDLAKKDNDNWVWEGASCLYPKYERCLVSLSRGGADATVVREFDTKKKAFVDGGFTLPEAKNEVGWRDENEVYVGTDFGAGSMTDSGYPRIVKRWKRGTPITDAKTVFEGKKTDVSVGAGRSFDHGKVHDFVYRGISTFESEMFLYDKDELVGLPIPKDANASLWDDLALVTLRSDWSVSGKTFGKGATVAIPLPQLLAGKETKDGTTWGVPKVEDATLVFEPGANRSLASVVPLKSAIITTELEDVHDKLYVWKKAGKKLTRTPLAVPSPLGTTNASPVDEDMQSDDFFVRSVDFTTPSTLYLTKLGGKLDKLKQQPGCFDAKDLVVEQHFAKSKDGTKVPYFQISKKDLKLDGENPTVLTGYGGFEISLEPEYDAVTGAAWLEKGGVYVEANIRGGGEYGPTWHDSAIKLNRQRAYDDFIAVSEDLVARKVTSTKKLGIRGGSNGGLLMGVMLTERPDLFGAVVCQAPLLDMKRYHKLLAGASWMGEYGNPDEPTEWAAIEKYSPYQNVKAGVKYPRTLFTTSTRDDRVHPGHARKMAAKMLSLGDDLLFYENIEGGHGGAANNEERAFMSALAYTFFAQQLKLQ